MRRAQDRWARYYDATRHREPRELFVFGLSKVPDDLPRVAIDIGFGAGNETISLIELGWEVTAIDIEKRAAKILKERIGDPGNLKVLTNTFRNVTYHPASFIHAGFSLPFCNPDHFDVVWDSVVNAITPRGIFCGQLFGSNDAWSEDESMTFHTKDDLEPLFDEFYVLTLEEHEGDRPTAVGEDKHWHYYDIIAQKE